MAAVTVLAGGANAETTDECEETTFEPVDLLFAMDVSGSMAEELQDVQENASEFVNEIDDNVNDARYGVASFSDYTGFFSYPGYSAHFGAFQDYPWELNRDFTTDTTSIENGIRDLERLNGMDEPESYARVLREAADLSSWRSDAVPVLVLWGDSYPHHDTFFDKSFGMDPGRDTDAQTFDDIDFRDPLSDLEAMGVRILAIDANVGEGAQPPEHAARAEAFFRHAAEETDGTYLKLNEAGNLSTEINKFIRSVTSPPAPDLDVQRPEEGFVYDAGMRQAISDATVARLVGDLTFKAEANSECPVDLISFEVEDKPGTPSFSWTDTVHDPNGNTFTATSETFPTTSTPEGDYLLTVNATDIDGRTTLQTVNLTIERSLTFEDPSPCLGDGTIGGVSQVGLNETVTLKASSPSPFRTVDLSIIDGPGQLTGVTQDEGTTTADFEWNDPTPGLHTVTVEASDGEGNTATCTFELDIHNPPPTASFGHTPTVPEEDQPVGFTDTSTDDNGEIVGWSWSFGDGDTSATQHPSHTYQDPGTFPVCLEVTDDEGASDQTCTDLTVTDVPPPIFEDDSPCGEILDLTSHDPASVDLTARSPSEHRTVSLALASGPGTLTDQVQDGNTTTATWSWDDPQVGGWTVVIEATDNTGETSTCTFDLDVDNPPPVADFTWSPTHPTEDDQVDFQDLSTDENGEIVDWAWTFPDGDTSDQQHPERSLTTGDHDVCLEVTDDDGATDSICQIVSVSEIPPPVFEDPSPCGEFLELTSHDPASADLVARSPDPDRTVSLALASGPGQLTDQVQDGNTTTATWSWDDPQVGGWTVVIEATDNQGETSTCTFDLDVDNPPPVADFTWSPEEPFVGSTVDFQDLSSDDNGEIVDWSWDLGDGNTSTAQHPDHTYTVADTFEVCLTVTDDDGATDQTCQDVTILEGPPDFEAPSPCVTGDLVTGVSHVGLNETTLLQATSPSSDRTVTLTLIDGPGQLADHTQDGNTTTAEYVWDDPAVGLHTVTVQAEDNEGQTETCTFDVDIHNPPPEASFECTPESPEEDQQALCESTSHDPNGEIDRCEWDIEGPAAGGGGGAPGDDPVCEIQVTWPDPGTFQVCLTVTDDEGAIDTVCDEITVVDVPPPVFTEASPCDELLEPVAGTSTSHDLVARSPSEHRTVSLALESGPGQLTDQVQDGNTTTATWSWDDPQVGDATVVINATDSTGEWSLCTFDLEVQNIPPVADFTFTPAAPDEDDLVGFEDNSSDENGEIVDWSWRFGDGTRSDDQDPQHTFAPGTFEVCLTVTDDHGATDEHCQVLTVAEVGPPSFTGEGPCVTGETIQGTSHVTLEDVPITAESPSDVRTVDLSIVTGPGALVDETQEANVTTASWTWDDPQVGEHTVLLRATDSQGQSTDCQIELEITNPDPVAAFTWTPDPGTSHQTVSFQDESTDENGQIVDRHWEMGDGATSTQQDPGHTFQAPGTFEVCLTVTDDDGATDQACQDVTVVNPPPVADFTWAPDPGIDGDPVRFQDESTDENGPIVDWVWAFGDGTGATDPNPVHTFATAGNRTVCLTVTDQDGATDQACKEVAILQLHGRALSLTTDDRLGTEGDPMLTLDETLTDTGEVRSDTHVVLPGTTLMGHPVHAGEGQVNVTPELVDDKGQFNGATPELIEATGRLQYAEIPLSGEPPLEIHGLVSTVEASCDGINGTVFIERLSQGEETILEAASFEAGQGPDPIVIAGAQVHIAQAERLGENGLRLEGIQVLFEQVGVDAELTLTMAEAAINPGFCGEVVEEPPDEDPLGPLTSARAFGLPGTADTGWVEAAGNATTHATFPGLLTGDTSDHRTQMRSTVIAEPGHVNSTARVLEHVVALDEIPGVTGPSMTFMELKATADARCDEDPTATVYVGEIVFGDTSVYDASDTTGGDEAVAPNTVIPLPMLGELVLNRQSVDQDGNITVTAAELRITVGIVEETIPIAQATADVDTCPVAE